MKCDRCGRDLPPESGLGDLASKYPRQLDGALDIEFSGGYGMFIDPMDGRKMAMLCQFCAHDLIDAEPWLIKVLGLTGLVEANGGRDANGKWDISGHNTGCYCWANSPAKQRFDEEYARQQEEYAQSK